jgi:ferredoxin/flavodoxin---NADP+ reductase
MRIEEWRVSEKSDRIVAVIGSGPAGLFAAKQLTADGCQVVLFNRDIKPGGLAEYGIYVDKHRMKEGLRAQFRSILSHPAIHYAGNVKVGITGDISLEDVRKLGFHAVLVTVGAQSDKRLGIPGENLPGVYHAKNLVYHYNHLPPFSTNPFLIGKRVAIVGAGNVMMDITHWLIDKCQVDAVLAVVRRGPAEVKFDKKELEGIVANLDFDQLQRELDRVAPVMLSLGQDPLAVKAVYQAALEKAVPHESKTRFGLCFLASPRQIFSKDGPNIDGLEVEETTLVRENDQVKARGTGKLDILPVDTVIFAIGDVIDPAMGLPVTGSEFTRDPHPEFPQEGLSYEVFDPVANRRLDGIFIAGWARQASTGLVGIARRDGTNGAMAVASYLSGKSDQIPADVDEIFTQIQKELPNLVTKNDVVNLEAVETRIAMEKGLEEFKFDTNEDMLSAIGRG